MSEALLPRCTDAPPRRRRSTLLGWAQLLGGLVAYGLAIVLMIRSGLGLGPWDAFHVGISRMSGVSVGMASIGVGVAIVGGTLLLGVRPGPGTLANMVLIGVFIDLLLPVIPDAQGWAMLPYHLAGIVLLGLATGMYIAPGYGKGPRDGLMLGVSERTGIPAGRVRTGIEASVLLLGWLMGGAVGVGTVLFALTIGPVTQWGLRLFGVPHGGRPSRLAEEAGLLSAAAAPGCRCAPDAGSFRQQGPSR